MSVRAQDGSTSLFERAEILSSLEQRFARIRASAEGRLIFVGGEAGVGKTALLRRFCEAQPASVRVVWGACEPLRTPRPLGPFIDVAESVGGRLAELVSGGARPHEVATGVLQELRMRPTVLVIEDAHWADEATLDVLVMLATRIGSCPALVLASFRDDELDHSDQLKIVLGELRGGMPRIKLDPLSPAAVAEMAASHGVDAEELYVRTGGNPFFVIEVLAAGGAQIPETVRDAILARTIRLSEPARALLDAVAVVPGQVELWLLELLAGNLNPGLDECLSAGMLRAGSTHVAFRHELARQAVEETTSPVRRLALHRTALAELDTHLPDFARLAHHAEAAGDVEAVLRWAPLAARNAAAVGAHRESAAQYERALRVGHRLGAEDRAELLRRLTNEYWMTDQFSAAAKAQREELELRRLLDDQLGEGDALRTLSRLMFFAGNVQEGEARALEAIELLERLEPGHELAMAYCNLSQRRMVLHDLEQARMWGERALELARRLDDVEAVVYALLNIGAAESQEDVEGGRTKVREALALAQANGLEDYAGRAFSSLLLDAARTRDLALAGRYLGPGLVYCDERGLDTWRLYLLACRAQLELDQAHWDAAAEAASLVLRDPRSATYPRGIALTVLGLVRARRGDPEASAPLEEEWELAQRTEEPERIARIAAARAEAAWLGGGTETVAADTDGAMRLALRFGLRWAAGDLAYWRRLAGVEEALAPESLAEPYAHWAAGEWRRASELWHALGCPYEAAVALADGDGTAMREGHEQLLSIGAARAAAVVARRLREIGVRSVRRGPRPTTRENPAGLTDRELEVLALLAEGLRNAEIAQRLVVSAKTVDHHVSAVLRKLEVRTRADAAVVATRLGIQSEDREAAAARMGSSPDVLRQPRS